MQKRFIKLIIYIIAIIIVLIIIFLSQQAYFKGIKKTFISDATNQAAAYVAKGANWAMSAIYPKINGGVKSGGEAIKNTANQTTDTTKKVSDSLGQKISNYFSNLGNSIVGKTPDSCPTQPTN